MREIKFRAWDELKKSVHEVAVIDFVVPYASLWKRKGNVRSTYEVELDTIYEVELDTIKLMQYTGLKDKNGKEIYEGDVVTYTDKSLGFENRICVVDYKDGAFTINTPDYTVFTILHVSYVFTEVIGNIWEHGDLLNGK